MKNIKFQKNFKLTGSAHWDNIDKSLIFSEEQRILTNLREFISKRYSVSQEISEKLVFLYGFNSLKILENGKKEDTNKLIMNQISFPILESQISYSIKNEMVIKINDFLCRRIGLAFLNQEQAFNLIEPIGKIMGKELNWNESKLSEEIEEAKLNLKYLF